MLLPIFKRTESCLMFVLHLKPLTIPASGSGTRRKQQREGGAEEGPPSQGGAPSSHNTPRGSLDPNDPPRDLKPAADPAEEEEQQQDKEDGHGRQSAPLRPNPRQPSPELDDLEQELAAEQAWFKNISNREELGRLREIRARYEAGDLNAVRIASGEPTRAIPALATPSASLPRLQPPTQFAKHN
ncbi:hypothetical protein CC86DRAFT_405962 [Ophiobolus disseminans]|uniref:Uncharacterized protein n=1 Tax=Ophiobolus disseminans TaxID=1469910 RepID=A0A6A7A054_9PLEO|nr:hypothetical protein CC86DRAFT_405962 [Ophiobolus disseminans]